MPTNNFLPFTPNNTGTNLLSQSDYAAAADRTDGNQPGIASSKLNNKAMRQATYIVGQVAQFISDLTNTDVLDDATPAKLLAQMNATWKPLAPTFTKYLSSSGTHNLTYYFKIATGSATIGATYTNNAITFTVSSTVASGVQLVATGPGAPSASGTLVKASGTGDANITFYAVKAPLFVEVELIGGGGGGSGSGSTGGVAGGNGGDTTFGTTLLAGGGGVGGTFGVSGPAGGSASLGSGPVGLALPGAYGGGYSFNGPAASPNFLSGGQGGGSPFCGTTTPGTGNANAVNAQSNTGCGGQGGGSGSSASNFTGTGGSAGGYVRAKIFSPLSTYAYAVGVKGNKGTAGTNGYDGGDGGSGLIIVTEYYQ